MDAMERRLAALEAEIAELRAASRRPRPRRSGPRNDDRIDDPRAEDPTTTVSRRRALHTAGAMAAGALAGGVMASIATPTPAGAAPLGPVDGNPAIDATATPSTGTAIDATSDAGIAVAATTTGGTGVGAVAADGVAISGTSTTGTGISATSANGTGLEATSTLATGASFTGAVHGISVVGTRAAMAIIGSGDAPPTRVATTFARGDLTADQHGDLWYCVTSGTPGTWRQLTGTASAGSYHPVTPARVYDSRVQFPFPGRLSTGQHRTVSIADSRDPNGSILTANLVPAGATAVFANVTVTDTDHSGWIAVNPGGTTAVSASAVNWSSAQESLANGLALTIDATTRQVTIVAGGPGSTDVVIDVYGYWR